MRVDTLSSDPNIHAGFADDITLCLGTERACPEPLSAKLLFTIMAYREVELFTMTWPGALNGPRCRDRWPLATSVHPHTYRKKHTQIHKLEEGGTWPTVLCDG